MTEDQIEQLKAEKNQAYAERNKLVALLARKFQSGIKKDLSEDPEWQNIIYIQLPNGQASWHVHESEMHLFDALPEWNDEWDGHTTEQKYHRIEKLCEVYDSRYEALDQ